MGEHGGQGLKQHEAGNDPPEQAVLLEGGQDERHHHARGAWRRPQPRCCIPLFSNIIRVGDNCSVIGKAVINVITD